MSQLDAQTTRFERSFTTAGIGMLILGLVAAGLGMAMNGGDANALPHAYMFGWVFWGCLTFGFFGLSLMHHAFRGHWGFPIIRIFEAGGGPINLGVFGALLLPVFLIWKEVFYPWARPDEVARDPVLQHRANFHYFDLGFVLARIVITIVLFAVLANINKTWLKKEEATGDDVWWKKRQYVGGIFVVLFALFTNFFWTDVLMSQYAHWYSTIYGVWFIVGSCLLAFSLTAVIVGSQSGKEPYKSAAKTWFFNDLGNWMLTFTMLWGYFSLSQYLIIWSGNLPEFTQYFIQRSENGWGVLGSLLIPLHFFIPFLLLLFPPVKKNPKSLAAVGMYILFARFLDLWYVVTPTWKHSLSINPLDIGLFLVFGGVWCLLFSWQVKQAPLITHRLPSMKEAVDHA